MFTSDSRAFKVVFQKFSRVLQAIQSVSGTFQMCFNGFQELQGFSYVFQMVQGVSLTFRGTQSDFRAVSWYFSGFGVRCVPGGFSSVQQISKRFIGVTEG